MIAPTSPRTFILTLTCPDRTGVVAAVSAFLQNRSCNISESAQFGDPFNGRFFLRIAFHAPGLALSRLDAEFAPIAAEFSMQAKFVDQSAKVRTLVMVSRFGHCLNDLNGGSASRSRSPRSEQTIARMVPAVNNKHLLTNTMLIYYAKILDFKMTTLKNDFATLCTPYF